MDKTITALIFSFIMGIMIFGMIEMVMAEDNLFILRSPSVEGLINAHGDVDTKQDFYVTFNEGKELYCNAKTTACLSFGCQNVNIKSNVAYTLGEEEKNYFGGYSTELDSRKGLNYSIEFNCEDASGNIYTKNYIIGFTQDSNIPDDTSAPSLKIHDVGYSSLYNDFLIDLRLELNEFSVCEYKKIFCEDSSCDEDDYIKISEVYAKQFYKKIMGFDKKGNYIIKVKCNDLFNNEVIKEISFKQVEELEQYSDDDKEENNLDCQNLYWIDNTNKECSQQEFCGAFMYYGLQTFKTKEECKNALDEEEDNCVCTMDAKMCADGSYVGRVCPDCEFAPCENQNQEREKNYFNLSNGKKAEIKIMPETASQNAIERLGELNFTIELKEVGANLTKPSSPKLVYELTGNKQGRFLGIFKITTRVQAQVDAETGETIFTKKPWWAFLATGI